MHRSLERADGSETSRQFDPVRHLVPTAAFVEFNKSGIEQSISSCFEHSVERHAERTAVKTRHHHFTYRELNQLANRIARAVLAECGNQSNQIALLLEHDAPLIAAILGVLKAGKVYVPLDPAFPYARNSFILEDAQAQLIVTSNKNLPLAQSLAKHHHHLINIDELDASLADGNLDLVISPDQLAYILYTSGSTGQPKGVVQNHRNVLNDVRQYTNTLYICRDDHMTLLYSCSVNGAVRGIYGALLNGAALYPMSIKEQGLAGLADWLIEEDITFYHSVPTVFRHFTETLTARYQFPKLRLIRFGGEQVLAHDVELYKRYFPDDCLLYTGMGATETGHIREYFIDKNTKLDDATVPTGYAIEDKEVLLLDDDGREVAAGEVGEIAVRSAHLALGYWQKPELTQAVFLPDPDGGDRRIYRTGDFGQLRADGCLIHRGRKDFQVKIRGFRVETGEIERQLCRHPEIREAVVVAVDDLHGEKTLIAYLVAKQQAPSVVALREILKQKLPDYMVPARFIVIDAIPLTPNGKLDRKALPTPDWLLDTNVESYAAPRNVTEDTLAAIWREILKRERIGIHDNFFDLGGHSLLGAQIALHAQRAFQVEIPLISLFEAPTIAAMAGKIERASPIGEGHEVLPIVPVSRDSDIELSFGQESLWFVEQLSPGSALYNIPRRIRMQGALDLAAFRQAFETIVARHESLRTVITVHDGRPIQTFSETGPSLAIIDLRALPQDERESEALRLAKEDARQPFGLEGNALMRAGLLQLGECDHVLLFTIHHIISDAWSGGIFFNELNILYQAFSKRQPSPFGKLSVQYADVTNWQRRFLCGEPLQRLLDYWKKQLAGMPTVFELPSNRPRAARPTFAGGRRFLTLPKWLEPALRQLSRKHNVTLSMLLLAVYQVLLSRYTSRTDIVVGAPIAGRTRPEMDSLMGYFVNTLLLRTELSGDPTVSELLLRVKETVLGAFAYQDLPFVKLVQELRPQRSFDHMPLCQVMFNMINSPTTNNVELSGLTLRPFDAENFAATASLQATHSTSFYSFSGTSKFDLALFMWEDGDTLLGRVEYNSDLFDASTIERLTGHYETLLAGIVDNPEVRISQLPLMTAAERNMLLEDFNQTTLEYLESDTIFKLFERQADKTPDAIAVVFEDKQLSYTELNTRANQLAHHLISLGVGPETLVAVCVDRSIEMIVALLGVLKAGGAYLPLNPEHPAQRLHFMLEDSSVFALITERKHEEKLKDHRAKRIYLDNLSSDDHSYSEISSAPRAASTNLAYVIYTSGSTGKPKGVMIEHRSVVNYLAAVRRLYQLERGDRVLQFASVGFDVSVREIFATLTCGATLVLCADPRQDARRFLSDCEQWGITMLSLPTAYWHGLAAALETEGLKIPPSLRLVSAGGEKMLADRLAIWRRCAPELRLINSYGPTETTVSATAWESVPGDEIPSEIPIGRPIANTQIYILDTNLNPVPIGIPGELHIGGAGLARGYLNRPELTAEKFIANPFSEEPGSRLYKTGDLARYRPDGNIEFLGRIDHQVKIRGFRIELGEIETVLGQHPSIKEAIVIAREDIPGDQRLVAYIVTNDTRNVITELRSFLKDKLPDYMLPSAFVMLDAMPLTPNGKVDRKALPAPDRLHPEQEASFVAPRDPIEQALADIWKDVLNLEQVGVHDNFFDLGGHSLLATQVISRICQTWHIDLPLRRLFEAPTITGLALAVMEAQAGQIEAKEMDRILAQVESSLSLDE